MLQGILPDHSYSPILFALGEESGDELYKELIGRFSEDIILDLLPAQKRELFKIRHPHKPLTTIEIDALFDTWSEGRTLGHEGIWVYYPWLGRLIHILGKAEFIELRTNRNHYKITPAEQQTLAGKTVGIIGLSVGHSVALTMAAERVCGKLKLADFDVLELSNLNRIRTGIQNIGLNKCVVAAREIAEIDPFLEIECYTEGINENNIEAFLLENGKLDILIDECDSLDIKIKARRAAKSHGIPVMMETSDRGMLDVERFDKEPERPLFHGLLNGLPPAMLDNISPQDRIPLTLRIVDAPNGSARGKASMLEVGRSISTWPQLASAVTLGGGVVTDVCRRMLLGQYTESGRYYVDLESLVADKNPTTDPISINPHPPFLKEEAFALLKALPKEDKSFIPDLEVVKRIVTAACQAPSAANDQPWKWVYADGRLLLLHDQRRAFSFADFDNNASMLSLGAAYENLLLETNKYGIAVKSQLFPDKQHPQLTAIIDFYREPENGLHETAAIPGLVDYISSRVTNRNVPIPTEIDLVALDLLQTAAETMEGAGLQFITSKDQMLGLAKIVGECDRMMVLNRNGHHDFFERDVRWPGEPPARMLDGIDMRTMGLAPMQMAALGFLKDGKVTVALKALDGGGVLVDSTISTISSAWGIGIMTMPAYSPDNFFKGGMAMQRMWLQATALELALQPLMSPLYLFARHLYGNGAGLDEHEIAKLHELHKSYRQILPQSPTACQVFIFKISKAAATAIKSQRLPLDETLFIP